MITFLERPVFREPDLSLFPERWVRDGVIFVSTHCLYDDGQNVTVELSQMQGNKWRVSDGGSGLAVLAEHLIEPNLRALTRAAKRVEDRVSVNFHDGTWSVCDNLEDQLPVAIMLVASAAQQWVNDLLRRERVIDVERLETGIVQRLIAVFGAPNVEAGAIILGQSTRPYDFTAVVRISIEKRAAFIAASPHGGSINSAYTKLMDVRAGEFKPYFAGIVIRSPSDWASEDIVLLRGACDDVMEAGVPFESRVSKLHQAA